MRSPGVIYRKYRQLRRKYLYETIQASRRKRHENCVYGELVKYKDQHGVEKEVKLCTYNCAACNLLDNPWPPPLPAFTRSVQGLDVCTCPGDCSAFAPKWSKEAVTERFEEVLKDDELKHKFYPELEAYQWVLDKTFTNAQENPGFLGKIIVFFIKVLEDTLKFINGPKKELG